MADGQALRRAGRAVLIGAALGGAMLFLLPLLMAGDLDRGRDDHLGYGILSGLSWVGALFVVILGGVIRSVLRSIARRADAAGDGQRESSGLSKRG